MVACTRPPVCFLCAPCFLFSAVVCNIRVACLHFWMHRMCCCLWTHSSVCSRFSLFLLSREFHGFLCVRLYFPCCVCVCVCVLDPHHVRSVHVLAKGRLVYSGPAKLIVPFFEPLGYKVRSVVFVSFLCVGLYTAPHQVNL